MIKDTLHFTKINHVYDFMFGEYYSENYPSISFKLLEAVNLSQTDYPKRLNHWAKREAHARTNITNILSKRIEQQQLQMS